jgi:hypothetical protein
MTKFCGKPIGHNTRIIGFCLHCDNDTPLTYLSVILLTDYIDSLRRQTSVVTLCTYEARFFDTVFGSCLMTEARRARIFQLRLSDCSTVLQNKQGQSQSLKIRI